ncbi:MAG: queuosine precursor transporter [Candidatus Lokiarchaeota archaeon]|nr:queuosine precursor transporter [Candidatus Lokiarchaeota archaeon]
MWIILIIWIVVIFVSTAFISQYIKMQKREDVAIAFYILFLTMSQILAVKIGDFTVFDYQITAPVAVLIFPFTFQITDMVNENFGQKATHRMIFIAFITQILMAVFIWFSIEVPAAPFWGFDWASNPVEAQQFWSNFLGSTIRITFASWISFIITENLDAILYAKIKKWTKSKNLWIRNVFSDIPTLALDSILFVSIAFGGVLPVEVVLSIIWGQMLTKWFFGIIDTPFMYLSRFIINGKINLLGNLFSKKEREFSE